MTAIKEKLIAFEDLIVEHRRFREAYEELLDCIQNPVRGMIIMVVGPTGVGKTRLKEFVNAVLCEYVSKFPEMELSAPLLIEAKRPEVGEYNWKTYFDQGMRGLAEPGLGRKTNINEALARIRSGNRGYTYRVMTTSEMREMYEQAMDQQRPIATLIDEAQSIGHCNSGDRRMANMDVVKGLSNSGRTVYVLFGTYEARNMLRNTAQLARRVHVIDFGRYIDTELDQGEFLSIAQAITTEVGFKMDEDVATDWAYFYNYTLGCAGILSQWLARALAHAYKNNHLHIERKDLEAVRLSDLNLQAIASEIRSFEFENANSEPFSVKKFFAVPLKDESKPQPPDVTVGKGRKHPGARDPFRDPVGTDSP